MSSRMLESYFGRRNVNFIILNRALKTSDERNSEINDFNEMQ